MLATTLAERTGQSELGGDAGQAMVEEQTRPVVAAMQGPAAVRRRGHERVRSVEVVAVKRRKRKAWRPSSRDELVYEWLRFEGKTQDWVARSLEISQATVSRIMQRYEKWQAHAQPGQDGSLSHAERQRMQWQLTYERNERILASSLRMAGDMEFPKDASKSVTRRPGLPTSGEQEIRTEYSMLDRSGMAARFLRLAFRINMEQMKLVEREPEALEPLTAEELASLETESDAVEAEIKESRRRQEDNEAMRHRIDSEVAMAVANEVERRLGPRPADGAGARDQEPGAREQETAAEDETLPLKMHKVHNCIASESSASADAAYSYVENSELEKAADQTCIDSRQPAGASGTCLSRSSA